MNTPNDHKPRPALPRRRFLQTAAGLASVIALPSWLAGCGGSGGDDDRPLRLAVLSDVHLYDSTTLGTSSELDAYLLQDRKMIKESVEIFDAALAAIVAAKPDALLISGDLTKDGERVNHELLATRLQALRAQGVRAYVIPGNHDVANPDAKDFSTVPATAAETVDAAAFATIYARCGYGDAIARDPASLSYVAELGEGVWLFAIDSCRYAESADPSTPITAGRVRAATLTWLQSWLAKARERGIAAIGTMHHGLIEHFPGQSSFFPEYLVEDRETLAAAFAAAGLTVVFTGHYHAQDIVRASYDGVMVHDVETGSTVTAPSPYRLVTIDRAAGTLAITSGTVESTSSHPSDFIAWSQDYLETGLETLVAAMLTAAPYSLPEATVAALVPLIVPAMVAHYAGDEQLDDASVLATLQAMAQSTDPMTAMLGGFVLGLWNDPQPGDNTLSITL
ncbi:metallophosphoesterase family protein [Rubrivivax gelatinosus]|uniref:3',5'-cyclic AMP phosphodiesterase CpdA n=1 Tax=Rubrivivax gelatinosus TaxID=28068 RepID=A0A4R2LV63_RUBGE|nr:metallophosphoesterase [Rubrivivax gelatinosus]MBK1689246.1 metallophosphoesterase [Rubrivivax gelatinosus]TCO98418.1 3',5'-cyclic AMP phosphodiesterase CpdA [Rubrivivax gelatinosus]